MGTPLLLNLPKTVSCYLCSLVPSSCVLSGEEKNTRKHRNLSSPLLDKSSVQIYKNTKSLLCNLMCKCKKYIYIPISSRMSCICLLVGLMKCFYYVKLLKIKYMFSNVSFIAVLAFLFIAGNVLYQISTFPPICFLHF